MKRNLKDASVDRLLAGALTARADVAPEGACLDADTLAAWADEALNARERASAEAHAADCGRCQALLAAMMKTMPPPSVAKSLFRVPSLWWLVPMTSAATALVIWLAVPNRAPVQQSDTAVVVDQVAPAPGPVPSADTQAADTHAKVQAEAEPRTKVATRQDAAAFTQPPAARERQEAAALAKRAAPAAPQSANALPDSALVGGVAPLAGAAPVPSAAPAAPSSTAGDASARREAFAATRLPAFANRVETVVVSSNPATRFRLMPGGGVQRSADGGATWRTEVTGATETLTAGASPSPSVCWLIGPSGMVLLSTDGRSWRRLAFPDTVDLRSVIATDNETATVETVDGRAFITTDGGRIWSRAPGI
jgi:hypothetical protein